jgi:hypothetical protein
VTIQGLIERKKKGFEEDNVWGSPCVPDVSGTKREGELGDVSRCFRWILSGQHEGKERLKIEKRKTKV